MSPAKFKEANRSFRAPEGLAESQCATIEAFGGSCDGVPMTISAWRPTEIELTELNAGGLVYLTFIGGLPPHFVTTSFKSASSPS